jgi:uncharacterized alpha-E superfamily protein
MGKHVRQKPTFTIDEVDELTLKSSINSERIVASQIREFLKERWEVINLMALDSTSPDVKKVFVPYAEGFKGALNALDDFVDEKEDCFWSEDSNKENWGW